MYWLINEETEAICGESGSWREAVDDVRELARANKTEQYAIVEKPLVSGRAYWCQSCHKVLVSKTAYASKNRLR